MLLKLNIVSDKSHSKYKTRIPATDGSKTVTEFLSSVELDDGLLLTDDLKITEVLCGADWSSLLTIDKNCFKLN